MKGKMIGEKNPMWKGVKAGYAAIHYWVSNNFGKPNKCEHCGKENHKYKSIHWANKSGNYLRDIKDWIRLCVVCHKKFDMSRLANK